jgi:hypothetical protein
VSTGDVLVLLGGIAAIGGVNWYLFLAGLPATHTTAIELTPERPGRYEFTCGMSMLRGSVTVEDEGIPS